MALEVGLCTFSNSKLIEFRFGFELATETGSNFGTKLSLGKLTEEALQTFFPSPNEFLMCFEYERVPYAFSSGGNGNIETSKQTHTQLVTRLLLGFNFMEFGHGRVRLREERESEVVISRHRQLFRVPWSDLTPA
jgi:hypothetical protein